MSTDQRAMRHFHELSADEKKAAIRDMAALGFSVFTIAEACRISVEQAQKILALPHLETLPDSEAVR